MTGEAAFIDVVLAGLQATMEGPETKQSVGRKGIPRYSAKRTTAKKTGKELNFKKRKVHLNCPN